MISLFSFRMLNKYILLSYQKCLPFIITKRFKVRHFPSSQKNDWELSFNFDRKPGKSFITEFFAFTNRKDAFTWAYYKERRKEKKLQEMIEDQKLVFRIFLSFFSIKLLGKLVCN